MTFWPAHKATRRVAAGQNVAEKNRTKAKGRLRFFVARAAYWRRSVNSPVMRSWGVHHYFILLSILKTIHLISIFHHIPF
jgi:hypothetical protein